MDRSKSGKMNYDDFLKMLTAVNANIEHDLLPISHPRRTLGGNLLVSCKPAEKPAKQPR